MAAMQESFDRHFFTPVAAVRPWLVEKCVLALLALDMWFLRLGSANRYDADELNLAHFGWLDALGPIPNEGLYLGVAVLVGLLALAIAVANLGLAWRLALVVLYSYTWAMSRLDSYQHHYLLSWVLLCIAFFPRTRLADFRKEDASCYPSPLVSSWAWVLLSVFAAIVYAYTAVAKLDPVWQSGACLQQLEGTATLLEPLKKISVGLGGSPDSFWRLVAGATVVAELLLAAGYLLMPRQDRSHAPWVSRTCLVCWLLAMGLHVSFEVAGLRIGWFSYFMMLLGSAGFLPACWLESLLRPFTLIAPQPSEVQRSRQVLRKGVMITAASSAILALVSAGCWSDLPGVLTATVVGSLGFVATLLVLEHERESDAQRRLPVAVLVGAILLALAVQFGDARAQYYPYRLVQLQRRGDFEAARDILPSAIKYVDYEDLFGQYNLAWFLATANDESLRSAPQAIEYAKRACELCDFANASALDALACAYAANGEFARALERIERAKQLLQNHQNDPVYATLLEHERLFSMEHPHVEPVRYRYRKPASGNEN